jgi:hypothetical protein
MKISNLISRRREHLPLRTLVVLAFTTAMVSLMAVNANPAKTAAPLQSSVWSLGGEAAVVPSETPHSVAFKLSSECLPDSAGIFGCVEDGRLTRSGVVFQPPSGPKLKFADLFRLSTDFNPVNSDCGAGSPRFEIGLDLNGDGFPEGSLFIYLGPLFNFTGCTSGWQNSGNLVANITSDQRFDLTQFNGPFYGTYFDALSLVGRGTICYVILVVDSGWWPNLQPRAGHQIIHVDTVRINQFTLNATNPPLAPPIELFPADESSLPGIVRSDEIDSVRSIRLGRSFGVWEIQ